MPPKEDRDGFGISGLPFLTEFYLLAKLLAEEPDTGFMPAKLDEPLLLPDGFKGPGLSSSKFDFFYVEVPDGCIPIKLILP